MEKVPATKKITVVTRYLAADTYDEIASEAGISKASVANIVGELKTGLFPEAIGIGDQIEQLHDLSTNLRKSGLSAAQCAVGLAVLKKIAECHLDPADINRWPMILKGITNEEEAENFVQLVYRITDKQEELGIDLDEADKKLHDLEIQANKLNPLIEQVEERQQELADLNEQRGNLIPQVNDLEQKANFLIPRVKNLEARESDLSKRIREQERQITEAEATLTKLSNEKKRLDKIGFSLEALTQFNDRTRIVATRHGVGMAQVKEKLFRDLESMEKGMELDEKARGQEIELKGIRQKILLAEKEYTGLKATIHTLEQQKEILNTDIDSIGGKIRVEMLKILPLAKETIGRFSQELNAAMATAIRDIQQVKGKTLEVGREIGQYETVIKENMWLMDLLSLARGENSMETDRIKVIMLSVLRGAQSVMKQKQVKLGFVIPLNATGLLIGELERWKTH